MPALFHATGRKLIQTYLRDHEVMEADLLVGMCVLCTAGRSVRCRHAAQLPREDQPQPPYTPTRPQARTRTQAPNSPQA